MPRKCSPSFMEVYLQYTRFQESPMKFHSWTSLYIIASAVKRNVYIDKFYYRLYPNIYIALVGPSAAVKKTTAADIAADIIETLPKKLFLKGKVTAWEFFHELGNATKTGDAAASIYSPEAKNLFGDLGKIELVTMLTDLYGSPANFTYRTLKHGTINIKNVCINLMICSTPEWLITGTTSDEMAGGWTGRFVYIFEETCDRSIAFPEDFVTPELQQLRQDLIDDLVEISNATGEFVLTPQAKAEYLIWYNSRKGEWKDERLMGYYGRKSDLVWKISMLLSLSRDNALVIDEEILQYAWKMLSDIEGNMGKALSHVVDDPALKYKDAVISFIVNQPGHRATRVAILKKFWNRFDSDMLDRIIRNAIECRTIKQYAVHQGKTSDIVYEICDTTINP
jgi:hypothetical protein